MKLRQTKSIKGAVASQAMLVAGGLISMNAHGMVPAPFDGWSANSAGTITTSCPSGYKCTTEISDKNFIQEIMQETDSSGNIIRNGKTFYRQIIAEKDMTSESIISVNRNQVEGIGRNGIALKQSLDVSQTTRTEKTNFSSDTTIYTGWASTAGAPDLQISQTIDETFRKAGAGGVYLQGQFDSLTSVKANYDEDGMRTGFDFAVNQSLEEPGQYSSGDKNTSSGYSEIDSQVFAMRGLEGDMLTSGGTVSLDGKSLSYNAGDKLWGHAIGQNFHHTDTTGEGSGIKGGDNPLGFEDLGMMFESYDNRSDSSKAINYFAYFENDTKGWPTVFGPKPALPQATGINGYGDEHSSPSPSGPSPTLVSGLFTPTAVGSAQADGRDTPIEMGKWSVVGGTLTLSGVLNEPVDISTSLSPTGNWIEGGDGTVIPDCAPGVLCETGDVVTPGMIQRLVTDSDGRRYIQTILTDLNGGGFSSESFVSTTDPQAIPRTTANRPGMTATYPYSSSDWIAGYNEAGAESGIALHMVVDNDTSTTGVTGKVKTVVDINTGWASRTTKANVKIAQDVDEVRSLGSVGDSKFDQQFAYLGNLDAAGNTIGASVGTDQQMTNTTMAFNTKYSGQEVYDSERFAYRSQSGNLQNDSRSASYDKDGNVTSIGWSVGDRITATWISNEFDGSSTYGAVFYDNLVDSVSYNDVGWDRKGYAGLGSDWISSAFGDSPESGLLITDPTCGASNGGGSGGGNGHLC